MALLAMIFLELGLGSAYHFAARHEKGPDYLSPMRDHDDIAKFLLSQPGQFRVLRDENEVHYNFGDFYGIEELTGYLASITTDLTEVEPASDTVRRMIGVRYYIGRKPFNTIKDEVFQSRSGLKVFADPEVFPRAFAVAEVKRLPSIVDVRRQLVSDSTDLKRTAFVSEPINPPAACSGDAAVQVRSYTPRRIEITADLPCARMVATSEVFYPGWRATIDGSSAHIYRTDAAFRGLLVPAGRHSLVFTYWPGTVLWGAALCAFGILLTLFLNFSQRPQRWFRGADVRAQSYN